MRIIKVEIILRDESIYTSDEAVAKVADLLKELFRYPNEFRAIVMDIIHKGEQG